MLRTPLCLTLLATSLGFVAAQPADNHLFAAARLFHLLARERVVLRIALRLFRRSQRRAILAEHQKERILFDHRFRQPRLGMTNAIHCPILLR